MMNDLSIDYNHLSTIMSATQAWTRVLLISTR